MTQPGNPVNKAASDGAAAAEMSAKTALVESATPQVMTGTLQINSKVARIPIEVDVAVPIKNFRVRNLLALEPGRVVESMWQQGEDLPLAAPGAQLAWSEFEVIDQKLAVRITRLI